MKKRYYSDLNPKTIDRNGRLKVAQEITKLIKNYLEGKDLKKLKVLDVGCSSGIISSYLAGYFGEVVGIDIDKNALFLAKKEFRKNLKFYFMNAVNTSFQNNHFDIVICNHVYYYLKDQKILFDEIYRVLKPGGICFFAGTNKFSPIKPYEPVTTFYKSFWELNRLVARFKISYQTKDILAFRFGFSIFLLIPDFFWKALEPITPNFVWIIKRDI